MLMWPMNMCWDAAGLTYVSVDCWLYSTWPSSWFTQARGSSQCWAWRFYLTPSPTRRLRHSSHLQIKAFCRSYHSGLYRCWGVFSSWICVSRVCGSSFVSVEGVPPFASSHLHDSVEERVFDVQRIVATINCGLCRVLFSERSVYRNFDLIFVSLVGLT